MTPQTMKQVIDEAAGPLRVYLGDGRGVEVESPQQLFVTPTMLIVGLAPDEAGVPTGSRLINYRQIVEIEPLPPTGHGASTEPAQRE